MRRTSITTTVLAAGVVVLSGCGSGDDGGASSASGTSSAASSSAASSSASEDAELRTADTDLGNIVVDSKGMTVYVFDKDTPDSGESSCTGGCLEAWPPVVTESDSPSVDGVTGEVATITRDDGTKQVTLDGWPLYYWQDDAAPGDTTGQAVQDVWWVVSADGTKITDSTAPASLRAY
jgi:predicted lipoprotein with Yx(FWY)xxD motif